MRVRVDGELLRPRRVPALDKYKRHTIEVVVDRLVVRHADDEAPPSTASIPNPDAARLADSVERPSGWARRHGRRAGRPGAFEELRYSEHYTCPYDGTIEELEPRSFSLQLAARRLPGLHRPGRPPGDRPAAGRPGPLAVDRPGRSCAPWARDAHGRLVVRQGHRGGGQAARLGPTAPVDKLPAALDHLL